MICCPLFISFVGVEEAVRLLFNEVQSQYARHAQLQDVQAAFLEDPFNNYETIILAGKPKRAYSPVSRTYLRLALFNEHNETVVKLAFKSGARVVLIPRFGYDLFCGAIAHQHSSKAHAVHKANLPFTVHGNELCPPLYVFTELVDQQQAEKIGEYFSEGSGQQRTFIRHDLSIPDKARAIIGIICNELAVRGELLAA